MLYLCLYRNNFLLSNPLAVRGLINRDLQEWNILFDWIPESLQAHPCPFELSWMSLNAINFQVALIL